MFSGVQIRQELIRQELVDVQPFGKGSLIEVV